MKWLDETKINPEIIEKTMKELKDLKSITIPCWHIGKIDGEEYAVLNKGDAEAYYAARKLGMDIHLILEEPPSEMKEISDQELSAWKTLDWYDIEASDPLNNYYAFVWKD